MVPSHFRTQQSQQFPPFFMAAPVSEDVTPAFAGSNTTTATETEYATPALVIESNYVSKFQQFPSCSMTAETADVVPQIQNPSGRGAKSWHSCYRCPWCTFASRDRVSNTCPHLLSILFTAPVPVMKDTMWPVILCLSPCNQTLTLRSKSLCLQ